MSDIFLLPNKATGSEQLFFLKHKILTLDRALENLRCFLHWVWAITSINSDWAVKGLRAALRRRTGFSSIYGFLWILSEV